MYRHKRAGSDAAQCIFEFPLACGITVGTPVRVRIKKQPDHLHEAACIAYATSVFVNCVHVRQLPSSQCECALTRSPCARYQIRGVPVGSVLTVQPSLERVDVLCDIKDPATVIPRNSLIEANQSGLIAEPLIDITPQLPIPDYQVSAPLSHAVRARCLGVSICAQQPCNGEYIALGKFQIRSVAQSHRPSHQQASPLDEECEAEGAVVCHSGRIKGQPGVAMDDLIYICTKLARQIDAQVPPELQTAHFSAPGC